MSTATVHLAIKADADAVWNALVDGSVTPAYYVGFEAHFDLTPGAPYRYTAGGGDVIVGEVVEVEPGARLVTTFQGFWEPSVAELEPSKVTFTLGPTAMPIPGVTMLSCIHEGLPETEVATHLEHGWVMILSGLKTLLETGVPMVGAPA